MPADPASKPITDHSDTWLMAGGLPYPPAPAEGEATGC